MQLLDPTTRPAPPPPAQSLAHPECDSRRSSFNDGERSRVLRDVKREEQIEFEMRCRIRGLGRLQVEDEKDEEEWVDCGED